MKKPTYILTADWHLRETAPVTRTDDFWFVQWKKVEWIADLAKRLGCPVLHSGDLFHHWKPSPYLLNATLKYLPTNFMTVYGNHDLPQHNLDERDRCGMDVLANAGRIHILKGTHFGQKPVAPSLKIQGRKILVWHVLTYKKELPFPGCTEDSARKILKKYKDYDLILTGDNHVTFTAEYNGRILVNPGSLTRQKADQIDHKPCVFLYYAETNEIERVTVPYPIGVISREHIDVMEQRDQRIDAFISSLNMNWESDVSFKTNLMKFFTKNKKIKPTVKELVTKFTEL